MDPVKTGMIILNARKKLNMTQKQLANKLYISDKAVSKWERGICFPDISVLIPLTEILNISLYDLLKGEKMNKKEVEETLKDTITFSNNEIKKKNKKNIIISISIILIIIIISLLSIIFIKKDSDIKAVTKKDKVHDISYYIDYKTTTSSIEGEKIEIILSNIPLIWKERTYNIKNNLININYNETYKKINKVYDENYVKLSMINISSVLFTTITDLNTIKFNFKDNYYVITKNDLLKKFNITSFDDVANKDKWENVITKKLEDKKFVNSAFDLFEGKN